MENEEVKDNELIKGGKKVEIPDKTPVKKEEETMLALMKKQLEQNEKQMKLMEERLNNELKKKDELILEEKKKMMTEEQKRELEKNQEIQKNIEQQAKILEELERFKKENDEIKKQNALKEFQNKKLIEKNKHPYIADKIEACEDDSQLAFLYKLTNFEKEKAIYDSDTNSGGSVVKIPGAKSKDDIEPKNAIEEINNKIRKMEEEMLRKRSQPGYRSY